MKKFTSTNSKKRKPSKETYSLRSGGEIIEGSDEEIEDDDISKKEEDDRVWVQCNTCDKWRALPSFVDINTLPDIWVCELNTFDPQRSKCTAPEENYEQTTDAPLRSFLKLWVKRIKCLDKAEDRMNSDTSFPSRGKRRAETEWIQCCNPCCGKWRSISTSIDSSVTLMKLNQGNWGLESREWFCSMNHWDETTASCTAPQEPIFDCTWNLETAETIP